MKKHNFYAGPSVLNRGEMCIRDRSIGDYRDFATLQDVITKTDDTATLLRLLRRKKSTSKEDADKDAPKHNDCILIVTSIQKLALIASSESDRQTLQMQMPRRLVFIVDECHRSTFGDSFAEIKATFPRAMFFGFTGTPIQEVNQRRGNTTTDIFGNCLLYTSRCV